MLQVYITSNRSMSILIVKTEILDNEVTFCFHFTYEKILKKMTRMEDNILCQREGADTTA